MKNLILLSGIFLGPKFILGQSILKSNISSISSIYSTDGYYMSHGSTLIASIKNNLYNYNHFILNVTPGLQAFDFDVFPNPAISWINVSSDEDLYSVEFLDPTMKLVLAIFKPEKQIDITLLSPGLYYLRATNIFKQSKTKIIVIQNEK